MSEPVLKPTGRRMPPEPLIQFRHAVESLWELINPILKEGEPGVTEDTGILKIGDGVSHWVDLPSYHIGEGGSGSIAWTDITGKPTTFTPSTHTHDDRYYTETETDSALSTKAPLVHNHDDRYYTETEIDASFSSVNTALAGKASTTHNHDDRYYTETEVDTALSGKAASVHTHDDRYYTESEVDTALAGKAATTHTHDDRYYTESEIDSTVSGLEADIAAKQDTKNISTSLAAATDRYGQWTTVDDGSSTTTWPNRFEFLFDPVTGETIVTFSLNEYGEARCIPAKTNTVGFRVFEKQFNSSTAHSASVPVVEVMDDRDNRNSKWAVFPGGKVVQSGALEVGGTVTAPNVAQKVRTVPTGTTGWASEPDGTLWIEYTP